MELAYLYIENYHNLKNVEFNFTQQLQIHYDTAKAVLYCNEIDSSLPSGFWGENIHNLTMIVGNNGTGKTSLMQYIASIAQSIEGSKSSISDYGILVLKDQNELFYYETVVKEESQKDLTIQSGPGLKLTPLNFESLKDVTQTTKLIYLTNAISYTDYLRNKKNPVNRFKRLYDCSAGGLMYLDSVSDINRELRQHYDAYSDFETYHIYEKYKQVKFVFDKNQYQILEELKKEGYPVPVPQKLYINFYVDNQLRFLPGANDIKIPEPLELNKALFPSETNAFKAELVKYILIQDDNNEADASKLLRYLFCTCCIWGMVRSLARSIGANFVDNLVNAITIKRFSSLYNEEENEFRQAIEAIWNFYKDASTYNPCTKTYNNTNMKESYKQYYLDFIDYIETETPNLTTHLTLEKPITDEKDILQQNSILRLSVSTSDAAWFMEFLKKYRYTADPDYYLDFDWGLSSGENNLISTFALLYCIFAMDYTNQKHGKYTIYNMADNKELVACDSAIIMIDEADLTFHPEWQREYIALLTAFLSKVYPVDCCKNIQLIMSTHSPILLGDIPQQNVIYLKTGQNYQVEIDSSSHIPTFGQNIHLLFRDGFFLKNGVMGKFARDKIQNCFNHLQQIEKDINAALESEDKSSLERNNKEFRHRLEVQKQFALLVAEPLIKKKLFSEIEQMEQKLPFKEQEAAVEATVVSDSITALSDDILEQLLTKLTQEKDRRKNDKNSNL